MLKLLDIEQVKENERDLILKGNLKNIFNFYFKDC